MRWPKFSNYSGKSNAQRALTKRDWVWASPYVRKSSEVVMVISTAFLKEKIKAPLSHSQ